MHRSVPPMGQARRPCVFCDETVLQAQGRIASNRSNGYSKTGMAHELCWANDQLGQCNENDSKTVRDGASS